MAWINGFKPEIIINIFILQYEKLVLTSDMEVKKVEFVLEERKVPLPEIREVTLSKHTPFMRFQSNTNYHEMDKDSVIARLKELNEFDEKANLSVEQLRSKLLHFERNKHFMMWHDNSTVANHGFLVCLTSVMYDPALFLTNDEYHQKTGKEVDVQTMVKKPEVHFVARCRSSEEEQMAYSETRMSCIKQMAQNVTTPDGVEVQDTLTFFHGDSPARQFECGQQKGGHYYCSNCGCHAVMVDDIHHALNCPLVSLQDRVDKIMEGTISKKKSLKFNSKPLKSLS